MFINRVLKEIVKEVSCTYPVLLVTGPRQVGKTTLLERVSNGDPKYVSLDDPVARRLAKEEYLLLLQNMYFMDTGLCAYLTRWTSSESLEVSVMSGAFFETFVVSEIIKSYLNAGRRPPVFYYRDSDQKEIDLIIEYNGKLQPIEIKKSANPKANVGRHFSVLDKVDIASAEGNVICMSSDLIPISPNNWAVPVWLI